MGAGTSQAEKVVEVPIIMYHSILKSKKELGFKAFLTCNEGINKLEKGDAKALSHLKRVNRSGNLTTYQFFQKLKSF